MEGVGTPRPDTVLVAEALYIRRGGGGEEWSGDACVAHGGQVGSGRGTGRRATQGSPVFSPQHSIQVRVQRRGGRLRARFGYTTILSRGFSSLALSRPSVLNSRPPGQRDAS